MNNTNIMKQLREMINLIQIIIGLSAGLATGAGFVALLTLLNIIPRLIQLSETKSFVKLYIGSVITGTIFGSILSFYNISWQQPSFLLVIWGVFHGVFNGLLAAALAEVLNVFPILFRRIHLEHYKLLLFMAIVFGKVFGSVFQWVFFVRM